MFLTDENISELIQSWNSYAIATAFKINPRKILADRDLNMYMGLGINTVDKLAAELVEHKSIASLEMTMGHLWERLLESLGPNKVTKEYKKSLRGIDHINETPTERQVINLKAGKSTANSDITQQIKSNLTHAKGFLARQQDDNPIQGLRKEIVMVRAVARGSFKDETTPEGIRWLVGPAMWAYFGGGTDFLRRIGRALRNNPIDSNSIDDAKLQAIYSLTEFIQSQNFCDFEGRLHWEALSRKFP